MLNKKNIAMAMAAATVAMPMTQSFAAVVESDQTQEVNAMKEKALELMNKEFTENKNLLINPSIAGEKIFKVGIEANGEKDWYTSYAEFERAFDEAYNDLKDGETIKINYDYNQVVNGNKIGYTTLADGTIVDFETDTYTQAELDTAAGVGSQIAGADHNATDKEVADLKVGDVQYKVDEDTKERTYQVKLTDGKDGLKRFADVKVGDAKLDFTKPVLDQKDDFYVDLDGDGIVAVDSDDVVRLENSASDATKKVVTINTKEYADAVVNGFCPATNNDAAETPVIVSDVIKKGAQQTALNSSGLYNVSEARVTEEGNQLLNKIQELGYDLHDTDYNVKVTEPVASQELKIVIEKKDKKDKEYRKVEEIRIARDAADKKGEAYDAMKALLNENYAGKIATAAGADRYATAAELSRKGFPTKLSIGTYKDTSERAVVLVTGEQDKLVDGLTATPLAASLNAGHGAPVLLTGNTKLAQPVIDEINRLDAQKVYIVGGAISEQVEKDLERVYGMDVTRVSGDDRYATSLEVADEIKDQTGDAFENVFIAGGKSEADALSAGAPAAMQKAPILLTNEDKLNKDVEYFLDNNTKVKANAKTYVVGGNISKSTFNDIVDVRDDIKVTRLSGDDRQDTNAKVIDKFFGNVTVDQVVVAKSDNKGMVDALGAGLYAGINHAPVVLATNDVTKDQEDVLNGMNFNFTANSTNKKIDKIQVGEGIASAVAKFIKNL